MAFGVAERSSAHDPLPAGSNRPIFAVPIANPVRCYAWRSMGRSIGADLDINERDMLARLGKNAAAVLAELENRIFGIGWTKVRRAGEEEGGRQ